MTFLCPSSDRQIPDNFEMFERMFGFKRIFSYLIFCTFFTGRIIRNQPCKQHNENCTLFVCVFVIIICKIWKRRMKLISYYFFVKATKKFSIHHEWTSTPMIRACEHSFCHSGHTKVFRVYFFFQKKLVLISYL